MRLLLLFVVAALHVVLILFFAVNVSATQVTAPEKARVMKVTDLTEIIPVEVYAPPVPQRPINIPELPVSDLPVVESIAEHMVETETQPDQIVVAAGSLITYSDEPGGTMLASSWDDYLPIHRVSEPPKFNEREIASSLVYPPIALRSGIEGRVILELFIDKNGDVQRVLVLREEPEGRGFGEAAIAAFTGKRATPAYANEEPVSARYRYPVTFKIK